MLAAKLVACVCFLRVPTYVRAVVLVPSRPLSEVVPVAEYPLLFRITHEVRCGAFEGKVVTDGRVLVAFEDGEWWCHGVEPGGMTECGKTPLGAFKAFRDAYCSVLSDLTEDCDGADRFMAEVKAVFIRDQVEAERWSRAAEAMRSGAEHDDEEVKQLPRMGPRDSKLSFEYIEHVVASATHEQDDELFKAA